ncbi:MAG TPA: TetR/AcrR family transcriptional regulator [Acidimicrobiia bacterium]
MRYRRGLEARERILGATRSLIADFGLEGTTIKGICARAEVLPGSFYNLFDSKEQAILTVVREAIDAVDPDPEHKGPDSLEDLIDAYIRFVTEQEDLARVYIAIAVSGGRNRTELKQRVLRHHEGRVERFAAAVARSRPGLDPGDARQRAEVLVTSLNGMTLHYVLDPTFDLARHARSLVAETVGA